MILNCRKQSGMELSLEIVKCCVIIGVLLKGLKQLMSNSIRYTANIFKRIIKEMDFG
jgi:hypothetical protein